jgi:hypothetical protein
MTQDAPRRGSRNHIVARAGKDLVLGELRRRGASIDERAKLMAPFSIAVTNTDHTRTVYVRVKTKTRDDWQTSIVEEKPGPAGDPKAEDHFWVFVDLGAEDEAPRFWVAPNGWVLRDIYVHHQKYLEAHGGQRARTLDSTHHAIPEARLDAWQDKWNLLGVSSEG